MSTSPVTIKPFVDAMFAENAFVVSVPGSAGGHVAWARHVESSTSSPCSTGKMSATARPRFSGPVPQVGWVIDPGLGRQVDLLLKYISDNHITIEKIVLTHGHADHIAGLDAVHEAWPSAEVLIGAEDEPMLADAQLNLSAPFGFSVVLKTPASGRLEPGTELALGETIWFVLDTSGHSPGGRSLYCPQAGVVFTGDALFSGSIGRVDFPGADGRRLIENIRLHLLTLPGDTAVYSGHGPVTTVRIEQKSNPFLADAY